MRYVQFANLPQVLEFRKSIPNRTLSPSTCKSRVMNIKVRVRTQWNYGWREPDLEMVSFSSCDFLCASKFLFSAFTGDLKRLYRSRAIIDPNLDEVLRFRP